MNTPRLRIAQVDNAQEFVLKSKIVLVRGDKYLLKVKEMGSDKLSLLIKLSGVN